MLGRALTERSAASDPSGSFPSDYLASSYYSFYFASWLIWASLLYGQNWLKHGFVAVTSLTWLPKDKKEIKIKAAQYLNNFNDRFCSQFTNWINHENHGFKNWQFSVPISTLLFSRPVDFESTNQKFKIVLTFLSRFTWLWNAFLPNDLLFGDRRHWDRPFDDRETRIVGNGLTFALRMANSLLGGT